MGNNPMELRVRLFGGGVGLLAVVIGLVVLLGWAARIPMLMSIRPDWIPMAPLTALGLALTGAALFSLTIAAINWNPKLLWISRICAALASLIGIARLLEHLGLIVLKADFLWFDLSNMAGLPRPAPMALGTALGLSLIGLALLVESIRTYVSTVQLLAFLTLAVGWLGLGPYFYGGEPLLPISGMASHTAMSLLVLGIGVLCARPDGGLVALTLSDTAGGVLSRWLLPPMMLLPMMFDYLRAHGEAVGWFGTEAGHSLFTLFTTAGVGLLIWGLSISLRRTELAQRRADLERARLSEIVEHSDDAILGTTLDGIVTAWNAGAERMYGFSRAEIVGQSTKRFMPPSELEREAEVLGRVAKGEHVEVREAMRMRKNGAEFTAWVKLAPVLDRHGQVIGVSKITRDMSESLKAEEESQMLRAQFEQAQKMESVGRLAGGVAHDFNNLLTVINGYTEFALSNLDETQGDLREDLDQVLAAGLRAAGLTRQLLAFSRRQVMRPKVLDVNLVIRDLDKMLRRLIGEDVEISLVLKEDLGRVLVDPGQIEQVLMNLSINARDAMPKGGRLTIETANVELDLEYTERHLNSTPGDYVMIAVTDTGVGMDSATMARIFEPFFTTKEFGKGTGLGLATVYGIVRQSGGNVWAYSEVGRGSVFKVYLPRTGSEAKEAVIVEPSSVNGKGESILVVEDDDRLRALTMRILTQNGYKTHGIGSGSQAIAFLREHKGMLQLVITDVVMPGISGMELARQAGEYHKGLRFMFMSGYTDDTITRHGVLDSNLDFVSKPFTTVSLLSSVRKALDRQAQPVCDA